MDLVRAGLIDSNLLYRDNELEFKWVAEACWAYQTEPFLIEQAPTTFIRFGGLDTAATVYLNGNMIGTA